MDFAGGRLMSVPTNGFEWAPGGQAPAPGRFIRRDFLVRRAGPQREITLPDDLCLDFARLDAGKEAILKFASRYGVLRPWGDHFHRTPESPAEYGERLSEWRYEIGQIKTTLDLLYAAENQDKSVAQKLLSPLTSKIKPSVASPLRRPRFLTGNLIDDAYAVVVETINLGICPVYRFDRDCHIPGCGFKECEKWADTTYAQVRRTNGRREIVLVQSSLITTLWLQLATFVVGQRKLKKCEAPDCDQYMDVTDSPRPASRRMHAHCEERIKKKRYRERQKATIHAAGFVT